MDVSTIESVPSPLPDFASDGQAHKYTHTYVHLEKRDEDEGLPRVCRSR